MTQISQSQVQAFPSTNVPVLADAKRHDGIAHEGLGALANGTELPVLGTPPQVHAYARHADTTVRARRSTETPPAPIELKGQRDVFTDTSDKKHQIEVTGPRPTITLGGGDNQISLKDIVFAKVKAGDGNNIIDSKDILARVTLGNGNNRYTGRADFLTLGNGNNIVSGQSNYTRLGDGNNQFTGEFSDLRIGNGNNQIRLTGATGPITLGSGSNTIDASGLSYLLKVHSNGGDTQVTNFTKNMDFHFSAGANPNNVSISRVGNDLVVARSGSKEKLTVPGYYLSRPQVTVHAGGSMYTLLGNAHGALDAGSWSRG